MLSRKEDEARRTQISIAGETFVLRSLLPAELLQELARDVAERFARMLARYPSLPRHRAALLAALELGDEVRRLREENEALRSLLDEVRGR